MTDKYIEKYGYYTIEKIKDQPEDTIVKLAPRYWLYFNYDDNKKFPVKSFSSKQYAIKYLNKHGVYLK